MATSAQVQQLYITYFGRPADPSGLAYWTADEATPLAEIANGFATTPEFAADIEGRSLDFIVNSFYVDLFGRNAEPEGLAFWLNQILIGNTTIQAAGLDIGNAALEVQNTGNADNVALNSKITASQQWTETVAASTEAILAYSGQIGTDAGVNYLLPVLTTATIPSEGATQAQIDLLIIENGNGATDTLELSVFRDVVSADGTLRLNNIGSIQGESAFKFTAGNQVVNGTAQTFSGLYGGDSLVDTSTADQDRLNVTGVTNFTALGTGVTSGAVVTNIETINIALNSANNAFVNGANATFTGVQQFNISGSITGFGAGITTTNSGATTIDTTNTANTATTDRFSITDLSNLDIAVNTSAVNHTIVLGNGADVVTTGSGDDILTAGAGADTVNLGAGANQFLDAGNGADTITHEAGTLAVTVSGIGTVTLTASSTGATTTSAAGINTTVNASTSTAAVTLTGGTGADNLTGGAGNDTVTGAAGADSLTGNNGVNQFGSAAGLVGVQGQGVAASVETLNANVQNGLTLTFGNGVDIITDFTTTTDKLDVATANTAATTLIGVNATVAGVGNTTYAVLGTFLNNVFTVDTTATAATAGVATAIIVGDGATALEASSGWTILQGVTATAAGDFV